MRKNADHLAGLFRRRGFSVETVGGPGSPVVFATPRRRQGGRHADLLHPLRRAAGGRRASGRAASPSRRACGAPPAPYAADAARTTVRSRSGGSTDARPPTTRRRSSRCSTPSTALKATGARSDLEPARRARRRRGSRLGQLPALRRGAAAGAQDRPGDHPGRAAPPERPADGVLRRARRRRRHHHRLRRVRRPALGQLRQLGARSVDGAGQAPRQHEGRRRPRHSSRTSTATSGR